MIAAAIALTAVAPGQDRPLVPEHVFDDAPYELVLEPATDLWFEFRTRAAAGETPAADDPLAPALALAKKMDLLLTGPRSWIVIDTFFLEADATEGYEAIFTEPLRLAAVHRIPGSGKKVLETGFEIGKALDQVREAWLAEEWPARREKLEAFRTEFEEKFETGKQLALLLEAELFLRMPLPDPSFPIRVVTRMPAPGEIVVRPRSGQMTTVVGVADRPFGEVAEVVVHESLHAGQARPIYPPTVFTTFRKKLTAAGVKGEFAEEVDHLLYYLAAAELVRRNLDREHVDYGFTSGYYDRLDGMEALIRPHWKSYVEGELDVATLQTEVAAAVASARAAGEIKIEDGDD